MVLNVLFLAQKDREEFNRIILSKPLARDLFISFARSGVNLRPSEIIICMSPSGNEFLFLQAKRSGSSEGILHIYWTTTGENCAS